MKRFPLGPLFILASCFGFILQAAAAQDPTAGGTPTKDAQAIAVLQQSVVAMGTTAPSDSTAIGTITTVAGSLTENGTVTILTRGTDQTSEQIQTPHGSTVVYSQGQSSTVVGSTPTSLPMERAVTSQSPYFPLALLVGALNNPDTAYKYVGLETLVVALAYHVQIWNSFASTPKLQAMAKFSVKDIWIDAKSGLPIKVSYTRRDASGASPGIAMEAVYSDYRNVSGVLYPFSIQASMNGTPWATITIQSVILNTGLTDSNFPVQTGVAQ
jgi:outer membrane lipoprotein-sorting protein